MIDFLLSTGIRVGKLVRLNIDDIDFSERECAVYGKGDKERKAYSECRYDVCYTDSSKVRKRICRYRERKC